MTNIILLPPIIVNAADSNNLVDLKTINILILSIPKYDIESYDIIQIYFNNSLYYVYNVGSIIDNIIIGIDKEKIRKESYNIKYTITKLDGNVRYSEEKTFYFKNFDEQYKIGEPLFPDARENVIDILTASTSGGLRVITDYQHMQPGDKVRIYWQAVYIDNGTTIPGTEYVSPEIVINETNVHNGYTGVIIPLSSVAPAKDIGIGQCYYTVEDALQKMPSPTTIIKIVTNNWNDGKLHTYHTTGIARNNPNYPYLHPYNFVTVVGDRGRDAIIETSQGMLIDLYNGIDEWPFRFDDTGKKTFRLFLNEEIPPFSSGVANAEAEIVLTYGVSYADARNDMITEPISFNNYISHDGPIRAYSYNSVAYNDNETPVQVLVILNRNVISNKINVQVDGNATINHFDKYSEIQHNDYTASFFVYNNKIENNNITVNIDNSAHPLRLNVNFIDPVKA